MTINLCSSSFPMLTSKGRTAGIRWRFCPTCPPLFPSFAFCLFEDYFASSVGDKVIVSQLHAPPTPAYNRNLRLFTTVSKYKREHSLGGQNAAA